MLMEFSVANYLSFKEPITLSMVASSIKEHSETNVFEVSTNVKLLKSAVVYGANASGKSNLIVAMRFMRWFVLNSSRDTQADDPIRVTNYRLSTETEAKPCVFEVVFVHEDVRYRYGFEVDEQQVHHEWLFYVPKNREVKLFVREGNEYSLGSHFKEGKGVQAKTRNNALFLSVVAQFNGEIATSILQWFRKLKIMSGLDNSNKALVVEALQSKETKERILELIRIADLGIEDLHVERMDLADHFEVPEELKRLLFSRGEAEGVDAFFSKHRKYDQNREFHSYETFNFDSLESEGTKKFLSLSLPILNALQSGGVLIVDELDAKLHPLLTRFIISLFHSDSSNSHHAQLIFATHDTNLLDKEIYRRDQVWFTEKDRFGCTSLYSLVEYKVNKDKVRNDASYGKDYLSGKYGAVPFIGNFVLFEEEHGD